MIDDSTKGNAVGEIDVPNAFTEHHSMNWWPNLSDLDRLNVLNNPTEDRARILSSKVSLSIDETMQKMSENTGIPWWIVSTFPKLQLSSFH